MAAFGCFLKHSGKDVVVYVATGQNQAHFVALECGFFFQSGGQ